MSEVHVTLAAEKLFNLGPLPVTNSLLTTWIVTAILISFAFLATKKISPVPQGLQNIAEAMVEPLQNLVESLAGHKSKIFLPIVGSFFFFILFNNYFGLLPGVGSIGFWEEHKTEELPAASNQKPETATTPTATNQLAVDDHAAETAPPIDDHQTSNSEALDKTENRPVENTQQSKNTTEPSIANHQQEKTFVPFLRAANSDLNTTIALALVSVIATHILAIKFLGAASYIAKWISLNPIMLFVGLLELVGEFTKIMSLSFRLFGNIYAGEVVLHTATLSVFAYLVPIPFYFLELLVGFVQALIFSILTLVFMVILTDNHAAEH